MAFETFEYTKSWENPEDFPTYEPDESRVRADLQWLHNEARDGLNRLIAALNDPQAASELPFRPEKGLTAQTVQDAIVETYGTIEKVAMGMIVDGSVTKEKLAQDLLERVYGGRVWASLDTPGEAHTPETDFPVGQMWLRPRFVVDNLALDHWSVSGWSAAADGTDWVLTTDGSAAEATATQLLESVGQAGQTVWVHLDLAERNDHLAALALHLNGVEFDLMDQGGVFETALDQTGSLELTIQGNWYFAESDAVVRIAGLAMVNSDALESGYTGCHPLSDWPAFLEAHAPFRQVVMPRAMWVQEQPGLWKQTEYEVLPVERGGTGLDGFTKGQMLYADSEQTLKALDPAASDNSFLLCEGSVPKWKTGAEVIGILGQLRLMTGQYTGNGSARTITLSLAPKLLYIYSLSGIDNQGYKEMVVSEQPALLADGAQAADIMSNGTNYCVAAVKLTGSTLTFSRMTGSTNLNAIYLNKSGVKYNWIALY